MMSLQYTMRYILKLTTSHTCDAVRLEYLLWECYLESLLDALYKLVNVNPYPY